MTNNISRWLYPTLMTIFLMLPLATVSAGTFYDVDEDQTFYEAIEFLTANGIVKGYSNGSYGPDKVLNRAELLKIIAEGSMKSADQDTAIFKSYHGKKCFNDVNAYQWYTKYICYAKDSNWVIGYENGKYFKPEQKVTFVEALKMTYKAFRLSYEENSTPWYKNLIDEASTANFIPFNITGFDIELRRDQMADLITRIIKTNEGIQPFENYLGDRLDLVVTYETLKQNLDLSKLQIETK